MGAQIFGLLGFHSPRPRARLCFSAPPAPATAPTAAAAAAAAHLRGRAERSAARNPDERLVAAALQPGEGLLKVARLPQRRRHARQRRRANGVRRQRQLAQARRFGGGHAHAALGVALLRQVAKAGRQVGDHLHQRGDHRLGLHAWRFGSATFACSASAAAAPRRSRAPGSSSRWSSGTTATRSCARSAAKGRAVG